MSVDRPIGLSDVPAAPAWASDAVAEMLRRLAFPYISLNPGASYRGLHDSLVNYLGNTNPEIVLSLHEEHAVAIAHGYAKVTEEPMAVALHSNVGLMHATMALFNAFCDRIPMLVLGATGPVDAARRRPWIDWIHTSADQGALIRNYVKWDDQPASVEAAIEAVMHADVLTRTYPYAPVYVCLDAGLQESPLASELVLPDPSRHRAPAPGRPDAESLERAVALLRKAERLLILSGRAGRGVDEWEARRRLAERLGACVLTDLKVGASFPTDHRLHPVPPATFASPAALKLIRGADVVLSLDWVDLAGTLREACVDEPVPPIVSCTLDHVLHNGWSKDHFALPPADVRIASHPDALVASLLDRLGENGAGERPGWSGEAAGAPSPQPVADGEIALSELARELRSALGGRSSSLVRVPLGWSGGDWTFGHPLDYLGQDGGAGIASGPGMAVGAALALRGSGRLPVAILGDGDYLMGATALWSAARYRLPLLVVVANNRSYFNDEVHQERVARTRGRPVENRWVGQHIRDPDPDLAGLARNLGLQGYGPVVERERLPETLARAVEAAAGGAAVVVDVHVAAAG